MEFFFNEALAERLQFVTLPLEVIGLSLALIEIRFPKAAAYLTRQIERLAMPMEQLRAGEGAADSLMQRSLGILLKRVLNVGLGLLTLYYLAIGVYSLFSRWPELGWLWPFGIGYLVSAISAAVTLVLVGLTTYFLVVGGTDFAKRFVAGRAIGGLGLLGEIYQFITQIVH